MNTIDERDINPLDEMTRIAKDILQLESRGFKQSYRSDELGKLIYDSEWCRINLGWEGWDYLIGNSMHIRYGRLHASNEDATVIWQGEDCRCWHRVEHALHFLDSRTPVEAAELDFSHPLIRSFRRADILQKFKRHQPEWVAQIHLTIWQQYGQRLFELFDLRQPDLWQRYRRFLKEIYDINGRIPEIIPPMDKVC